jgi:hypothetical protein
VCCPCPSSEPAAGGPSATAPGCTCALASPALDSRKPNSGCRPKGLRTPQGNRLYTAASPLRPCSGSASESASGAPSTTTPSRALAPPALDCCEPSSGCWSKGLSGVAAPEATDDTPALWPRSKRHTGSTVCHAHVPAAYLHSAHWHLSTCNQKGSGIITACCLCGSHSAHARRVPVQRCRPYFDLMASTERRLGGAYEHGACPGGRRSSF